MKKSVPDQQADIEKNLVVPIIVTKHGSCSCGNILDSGNTGDSNSIDNSLSSFFELCKCILFGPAPLPEYAIKKND